MNLGKGDSPWSLSSASFRINGIETSACSIAVLGLID